MPALSQHQPQKDSDGRAGRLSKDAIPVCPTDDEAVVPRKSVDKQSFDYLWRSGTAGGLAGCAVSCLFMSCLGSILVLDRNSLTPH